MQPASPPTAPHRRLRQKHHVYFPQPALQKETSRHDTATRKRASKAGGDTKITVFPTWHRGCAVSPPRPPLPGGLAPLPPLSPSRSRGAAGAEGAKWDFFMGLGEHWKLDITRATMKPPPKYPPPPGTHTHARTHQDTDDHTRGNIAPAGTPRGKTPSRPQSQRLPSPQPHATCVPVPNQLKTGDRGTAEASTPPASSSVPKMLGGRGEMAGNTVPMSIFLACAPFPFAPQIGSGARGRGSAPLPLPSAWALGPWHGECLKINK